MFEYYNPQQFAYTPPTATQPYGYPLSSNPYYPQQTQQTQPRPQTNTNKVFVNGIEDVKNRVLPANSEFIFLDNDKSILYQKKVDANGQFEVKVFDILPHVEEPQADKIATDLSNYVPRNEFEALQGEFRALKEQLTRSENNGKSNNTPATPAIPS